MSEVRASVANAALYPRPAVGAARPSQSFRKVAGCLLLSGVLGAALGIGLTLLRHYFRLPRLLPLGGGAGFFAGFLLSLWPQVLLHEASHALAGKLVGMRLYVAGVGPWRLQCLAGRWRVFRIGGIRGLGGFAAMASSGRHPLSNVRMLAFTLGGIAGNLLAAAACLALIVWLTPPPLAHGLLGGAAAAGLLLALANAFPFVAQGWYSDGKQALGLLCGDPSTLGYLELQRYGALMLAGVRPRDWPPEWRPSLRETPAEDLAGRLHELILAQWSLDADPRGGDDRLWPRIVAHHAELPDGMRQYAALAMADYAARVLRDAALLQAWRAECEGGLVDLSPQRAWLDAALARLQRRDDELPALIDAAEALLPRASDPASRAILAEHLLALRRS
ncbi:hypothetical protein EBB59_03975 [Lysobacter pythonis]|uniref:Peptidase M50 domain-containing protein n=1 Tax=Solilutibacter pythonis TaxID=2483112 RepID=A0A3M2I3M1_9GAMM|nr:site-2 protease family protein [Lysobacter pythonis]RMH93812.1 hypothetical protein EBB59_03975 [Lysobacter pythonis]